MLQAGVALAEWCLTNKSLFNGSCVLELGSGCGLTGLVTAVSCGASQVVLSDGHEAVMDQLSQNVSINSNDATLTLDETERVQASVANTKVSVQYLPWSQIPTNWKNVQAPDIILAAGIFTIIIISCVC
jgi:predicted nicotinamide N-methyase